MSQTEQTEQTNPQPPANCEQLRAELAVNQERENEAWRVRSAAKLAFVEADAAWGLLARRSRETQEAISALEKGQT